MQTILETDALRIRYRPGQSRVLFVSFTGVLHGMGGIAVDEFAGSGRGHHCLFVSDLQRTWYNGEGIAAAICVAVRQKVDELHIRRIVTIGNPMGGFGAILFARLIGAQTAIAFSPQLSFHKDIVPGEDRWDEYRAGITTWQFPTALPFAPATRYFIFSGHDPMEMQHTRLFPTARNVAIFLLAGGHTVAQKIKDAGQLASVIGICARWPMFVARSAVRRKLGKIAD
jgi:hypothetical protein